MQSIGETVLYIGHYLKLTSPSEEPCSKPPGFYHLIVTVTCAFKRPSHPSLGSAASGLWKYDKASGFHDHGCGVISLVRSNTVWDTMSVDQTFCKSMDVGFGRSITCRKGKYVNRVRIYFSKDKALTFPWRKWSNVVNHHQAAGWSPWGIGFIPGAQC